MKALKLPIFRILWSRPFHYIIAEGKTNFWKIIFCFEKRYNFSISSGVREIPSTNLFKKILRRFIFVKFVKVALISEPAVELRGI